MSLAFILSAASIAINLCVWVILWRMNREMDRMEKRYR